MLTTLAGLYEARGQYDKAEVAYQRALRIVEDAFGKDHPSVAMCLYNQALLYQTQGQYAKAEPLAQRALDLRRARLGKAHPATIASQMLVADLRLLAGRHAEAVRLTHVALQFRRAHQVRVLPALGDTEQLAYLRKSSGLDESLSLALAGKLSEENKARTAAWLVNGKAVAQQAVAERMLLAREARSEEARRQLRELTDVRQELARLALEHSRREVDEARRRREELTEKERELSAQLQQYDQRGFHDEPWVELDELTRRLPAKSVYLDFARFDVRDFKVVGQKKWRPARYAVWVTTAQGEVDVVDLGEAAPIAAAVQEARQALDRAPRLLKDKGEVEAEKETRPILQRLADLIVQPLRRHLDQAERWVICPDSNLWLVPWAALPLDDQSYAVEKHTVQLVVSGRDLIVDPLRLDLKGGRCLVVANPDFDLAPQGGVPAVQLAGRTCTGSIGDWRVSFEFGAEGKLRIFNAEGDRALAGQGRWWLSSDELTMRTSVARFTGRLADGRITGQRELSGEDGRVTRDRWQMRVPEEAVTEPGQTRGLAGLKLGKVRRLPGTAREGAVVAEQLEKLFGEKPSLLTGANALTAAVRKARSPRALVLASHGYFLPDASVVRGGSEENASRPTGRLDNPLLRCGLLLAGCNHAEEANDGQDSGVLTGLDVIGLDLRGTELVVLSACETGLGDVRNGEGVAGLRQAFQLAGARSVLASLWQISDSDTAQLMRTFFDQLAKGKDHATALREAQLSRIKARRKRYDAAHPFFWAAFTLTGR